MLRYGISNGTNISIDLVQSGRVPVVQMDLHIGFVA